MTDLNDCRYLVAVTLSELAKKWGDRADHTFTGAEVAEVLQNTSDDLMARVALNAGETS